MWVLFLFLFFLVPPAGCPEVNRHGEGKVLSIPQMDAGALTTDGHTNMFVVWAMKWRGHLLCYETSEL